MFTIKVKHRNSALITVLHLSVTVTVIMSYRSSKQSKNSHLAVSSKRSLAPTTLHEGALKHTNAVQGREIIDIHGQRNLTKFVISCMTVIHTKSNITFKLTQDTS